MTTTNPPFLSHIDQVCVVTRDLHRAMERYHTLLGMGPFQVYTFSAPRVKDMTYRGKPTDFAMKVAFTQYPTANGRLAFELIEPIKGPTIYHEFLERNHEGIQHFGVYVSNLEQAIEEARQYGFEVIQSGRGYGKGGDGGFAYIGTEGELGAIFELIEAPAERYAPEEVYPS